MADNNENFKAPKSATKIFIEETKKPQDWSQLKIQQKFDELGFDFPTNKEELKAFNEKFRDYPYKLSGSKVDPVKIINSTKL